MRSYRIIFVSPRHQIWSDDGVAYFKFETNNLGILLAHSIPVFIAIVPIQVPLDMITSLQPPFSLVILLLLLLFRLFPSGVATADFPSPVVSINCIFLRHFNLSHVLFHHTHKPPFWPSPVSSFLATPSSASFSKYTHHLSSVYVHTPPGLSPNLPTSSDVLIPDIVHSCHS